MQIWRYNVEAVAVRGSLPASARNAAIQLNVGGQVDVCHNALKPGRQGVLGEQRIAIDSDNVNIDAEKFNLLDNAKTGCTFTGQLDNHQVTGGTLSCDGNFNVQCGPGQLPPDYCGDDGSCDFLTGACFPFYGQIAVCSF